MRNGRRSRKVVFICRGFPVIFRCVRKSKLYENVNFVIQISIIFCGGGEVGLFFSYNLWFYNFAYVICQKVKKLVPAIVVFIKQT